MGTPSKTMFLQKPLGSEIWFQSLLSKFFHLKLAAHAFPDFLARKTVPQSSLLIANYSLAFLNNFHLGDVLVRWQGIGGRTVDKMVIN